MFVIIQVSNVPIYNSILHWDNMYPHCVFPLDIHITQDTLN